MNWELCKFLFTTLMISGCSYHSTSNQAATPSSHDGGVPTEANKFFSDPKVAAMAAALERSDWAGADKSLRDGADVNAIGKDLIIPLVWTMYVKNKAAFEWLLNHGADPNFVSGGEQCALILAAEADDGDWLRILLRHKADPNLIYQTTIKTTGTPLLAAVNLCRVENIKMLIVAGANISYQVPKEDGGGTPAIDAAGNGCFEGLYILLEAGADIRPHTAGGADVAYMIASNPVYVNDPRYSWREKVLQLLREKGADVDGALKEAKEADARDRKENPWRYHN